MAWAVATSYPTRETFALDDLKSVGLSCYLPQFQTYTPRHGRLILNEAALFPGYMFFLVIQDLWKEIFRKDRALRSVRGVLMSGEKPARVSGKIISLIRSREGPDGFILVSKSGIPRQRFRRGQRVRVVRGHLTGSEGLFEVGSRSEAVKVLFNMMGRKVSVLMRDDELTVA